MGIDWLVTPPVSVRMSFSFTNITYSGNTRINTWYTSLLDLDLSVLFALFDTFFARLVVIGRYNVEIGNLPSYYYYHTISTK